jgi:hypothetical protein
VILPTGDASLPLGSDPAFDEDGFFGDLIEDDDEAGFVSRVCLMAAQVVGASAVWAEGNDEASIQTLPLVLPVLFVVLVALLTRAQARRLSGIRPLARLLWGAATAIPLAILMGIVGVIGKTEFVGVDIKVPMGGVIGIAMLWGVLGGLGGAWWGLDEEERRELVPQRISRFLAPAFIAARTLLVGLAFLAVVLTAVVVVQTVREAGDTVSPAELAEELERSVPQAAVENALYAAEHGIHGFALGTLAEFKEPDPHELFALPVGEGSLSLPVPVTKASEVVREGDYRLMDYDDALPGWLFACALIALIAVPVLLSIYAGYVAARAAAARGSTLHGAILGAIVGPVWAVMMVVLSALASKTDDYPLWGIAEGGSVFGLSLLFGLAGGALGGLLASQGPAPASPAPTPGG